LNCICWRKFHATCENSRWWLSYKSLINWRYAFCRNK
jgi:hypothetical protein